MGKNTGDNHRIGAVKDRSQCYNEATNQYMKRDGNTGKFISSKSTPYKGVTTEKKSKNNVHTRK